MKHPRPTLYIFSGLPAVGKTTLSRLLASHLKAVLLRVDTIKHAMREQNLNPLSREEYILSSRIARENLAIGNDVIADCCNPNWTTREAWISAASLSNSCYVIIEIVCSDNDVRRHRYETRNFEIENFPIPGWRKARDYPFVDWGQTDRIVIDTANHTAEESFETLLSELCGRSHKC